MNFGVLILFRILLITSILFCFSEVSASKAAESATHIYILMWMPNQIKVIDRQTEAEHYIQLNLHPHSISVHKEKAYIVHSNPYAIAVIDLNSEKEVAQIRIMECIPKSLIFSENRGYYIDSVNAVMCVIDLDTNRVTQSVYLGGWPNRIALYKDEAWITNRTYNNVVAVHLLTYKVDGSVSVENSPNNILIQGEYAYVSNQLSCSVAVINVKTRTLLKHIHVVGSPKRISVHGNYAFVPLTDFAELCVIDLRDNKVIKKIYLRGFRQSMCVKNGIGYCNSRELKLIFVIDLQLHTLLCHKQYPDGFDRSKLFLSDSNIYLGDVRFSSLCDNVDRLTCAELFKPAIPPASINLYEDGEAYFEEMWIALKEGKQAEAQELFAEALYCNQPKALSIAAFSYLTGKWGVNKDLAMFSAHYDYADQAYFTMLCQRFG